MKEIALVGTINHVSAEVLSSLLEKDLAVNAMVDFPEKVMLANNLLTVTKLDQYNHNQKVEAFQGYHDVVLTYNDNLQDATTNDITLKTYVDSVNAAREAGVNRLIVVGSPDSEAFFVTDLRRLDDIDWVFVSTEGAFAEKVTEEVLKPSHHREIYA